MSNIDFFLLIFIGNLFLSRMENPSIENWYFAAKFHFIIFAIPIWNIQYIQFVFCLCRSFMCTAHCMDIVSNCLDNGIIEWKRILNTYLGKASTILISELTKTEYHIRYWNWYCAHADWIEARKWTSCLLFTIHFVIGNVKYEIFVIANMYCFSCVWCVDIILSSPHYQQSCDLISVWILNMFIIFILLLFILPTRYIPMQNIFSFVALSDSVGFSSICLCNIRILMALHLPLVFC